MHRRNFLHFAGAAPASLLMGSVERLFGGDRRLDGWRTFEVTTHVEVLKPSGATRIWVPAALISNTPYQRTLACEFKCEGSTAKVFQSKPESLGIVYAEFSSGTKPSLTVVNRVATRDRSLERSARRALSNAEFRYWLRPTNLISTDGIVKERALAITGGARTDVDKARAIYEWIVENTYREPKTRGCGTGNIRYMLESGDLGGKCADLNSLYVGLARAAGLPARDAYGIRVAKSRLGYKSLGTSSEKISKAQHCRAEVYLSEYGWVAVDPADVRKVMLEEPPGNRPPDDKMVEEARARLFGSWEMNWIAYNFANDVMLPGSRGAAVGFLMYPQAETAEGRLDSLDPDGFRYEIVAREINS
jgi:transglutaminase-like putative cysteine protease